MKIFKINLIIAVLFLLSCHPANKDNESTTSATSDSEADTEWALLPFNKVDSMNPILKPSGQLFFDPIREDSVAWEAKNVFNPAVIIKDKKVYMFYRAQDSVGKPDGTSRIGLAVSEDGLHFTRYPYPVLYPENDNYKQYEWQGGCEDPRIVQDSAGTYYMIYTAYDGKTARLFVATSKDLMHWLKWGNAFANAYGGKYKNTWTKSGSIVCKYENGTPVAVKINGKYWMYWGDQFIWAATSDDLIHWTPIEMKSGEVPAVPLRNQALTMADLQIVIPTRKGLFDNDLVEPGPPAILTKQGIVLIYNSRYIQEKGSKALLPSGTYSAGQVLLDKNNPTEIVHRLNHYFIKPTQPYEMTGEVNNVCFLEGLIHFEDLWFLYYGTADSKIAVAVSQSNF